LAAATACKYGWKMIDSTAITRKVVRRALRIIRPSRPWVLAQHNPAPADVLSPIRLFAIVGAWMEGDVIAATVRNAFAQGCERVYLVDNDSPDDTVKEALSAGAVLAERFRTEQYDENLRLEVMNRVVQTVSNGEKGDHIWWLWLDADEFPHGPNGSTVFEFLGQIDRRFRIVGARFINHFPSSRLAYVSGFHPLDFQPLCEEHRFGCSLGHRKHPLQRFDRLGKRILCNRGFHTARSEERPLLEPSAPIFLHHFPYRNYEITKQRLTELCGKDFAGRSRVKSGDDAADGMIPRFQSLEAVYRGDWQHVRNYRPETGYSVPAPVPWPSLVGSEHLPVKRWYRQDNGDHVHVSR
jgi:hypothetical protein